MNFSLLCPSKDRPDLLYGLWKNLITSVNNPVETELLLKFDRGSGLPYPEMLSTWMKVFHGEHSDYLQRDYYNWLSEKASGKYLWGIGDDVRFETKHWDILLQDKIEEYLQDKPDRIAMISVTEMGSTAKHPCFPLITREAFIATGMYFHPQLLSWGADRTIYELYSGVGRVLHVPEIEIRHLSYHDGTAVFDRTAESMRERFFRNPNCHNEISIDIIPKQIIKLQEYINEQQKN